MAPLSKLGGPQGMQAGEKHDILQIAEIAAMQSSASISGVTKFNWDIIAGEEDYSLIFYNK